MNNKKKAESLVGIIIGVFILSFILVGMINVIGFSKDISYNYENKIEENLIETNSKNIISKLNTDNINTQEEFYVFKDIINKEFKIMTGAINKDLYSFVDKLGNNISSGVIGKVFERKYQKKLDILRHVIYPPEIDNLVFHFDASNTGSLVYDSSSKKISIWKDLSGNNINAYNSDSNNQPILVENVIGEYSGVKFDGVDDLLKIDNNIILNNDDDGYANRVYEQKSYAIVFKTGDDITSDQVIYEEGGAATGYNFMIHQGKLYAGIHNIVENCSGSAPCFTAYLNSTYSDTDTNTWYYQWKQNSTLGNHRVHSIELDEVLPDTLYFISIIQDSSHFNNPSAGDGIKTIIRDTNDNIINKLRDPINTQNKLQIFLNGNLVKETTGVDPMPEHHLPGLGNINEWSVTPWSPFSATDKFENLPFKGVIGEFISRNHALTQEEVRGVQNYFVDKWLGGIESVRHNIIETNVSQIK